MNGPTLAERALDWIEQTLCDALTRVRRIRAREQCANSPNSFFVKKVAQSKSLFDDPADKIEELTGIIKLDIQAIRKKLQNMESMVVAQGRQNEQTSTHSGVVIDTLANNLGATAMQFTKILELRTEVRPSYSFFASDSYLLALQVGPQRSKHIFFPPNLIFSDDSPQKCRISSHNKIERRSSLEEAPCRHLQSCTSRLIPPSTSA